MTRFRSFMSIVFLSFMLTLLSGSIETVRCDDWKLIGEPTDSVTTYYNVKSVKHKTRDIVQVWIKNSLNDDRKNEEIENRKKIGLPIVGWDRLSYFVMLLEINCKEKKTRSNHVTSYRDDGEVLESTSSKWKGDWTVIVPDSMGDDLLKEVCNTSKRK